MKVKTWMSSPVITVDPDCPAVLAFRKMVENQIRRLVVTDSDDNLLGIITDRDLRGVVYASVNGSSTGGGPSPADVTVESLMTPDVISVTPATDVKDAALLMHNHKISGLPVVVGGKAVGMITVQDLMEILVASLDGEAERSAS
jgi:CBS domain-containing protein